jgi:phosphoglucosamine mutase
VSPWSTWAFCPRLQWRSPRPKFFAAGGRKLSDEVEERLESELLAPPAGAPGAVGRFESDPGAAEAYVAHLAASLQGRTLHGLHVVADCGHGAASALAGPVLEALGATVTVLNHTPDGTNINAGCGSTHPAELQAAVVERHADVGLAFDGDADRVLAVDHEGRLVDGDHLIALCASDLRARGGLHGDTVVVTVMTNLGFRLAMADQGIAVHETQVGDRYVLEALEAGGWSLGGEQSGHVIFRDLATTGDGLLTGLQLLDLVRRAARPLAELAAQAMTALPQVLKNVRVSNRDGLADAAEVWDDVRAVEAELGERGRVLLRPSGTEPLVRVMVEAADQGDAERAADRLVATVSRALGV